MSDTKRTERSILKKSIYIFIGIIVSIMLLAGGFLLGINFGSKPPLYAIGYGDTFNNINIYSLDDEIVKEPFINNKGCSIVFYLSETCSDCLEALYLIDNILISEFNNKPEIYLLWKSKTSNKISNHKLNKIVKQYTLNNECTISESVPTTFFLEDNKVIFFTNDINKAMRKMVDTLNINDKIQIYSDIIFKNNITDNKIAFITEDCGACDSLATTKDGIFIISDFYSDNYLYDKYHWFANIFGVNKFPCFVYLEDNNILMQYP